MRRKRYLLISLAIMVVSGLALILSSQLFLESAVKHRAISAPRAAFRDADRFEILFLEPGEGTESDETFSVSPFRQSYRVVETVRLSDAQSAEFSELISDHFLSKEFSAMCHDPHHAIRAFNGSNLLFEATLCLECINMEFAAFRLFPVEVTMMERDHSELNLPELEKFLGKLRD